MPSTYQSNATQYATAWEQQASTFFEVSISPSDVNNKLNNYVTAANLSSSLLYGGGCLNATGSSSASNSTSTNVGWAAGNQTVGSGSSNSTFYALSIKANQTAVEVQNSDLGFVLLYGDNVPQGIIQATVEAMQPYPRGMA